MHDELIAQSNIDSLDSLAFDAAAERFVLNYYMAHWYDEMDPDTMGADSSMCCDSMFTNFEQSDTLMECFHLYDGVRREVSNCNTNSLSFIHLPEESIPDPAPDPLFEFNFNPNDNGDPLTINDFSGANFHSFELFIDEDDGNIPDFINAVPPSGNRSVKINNDHTSFHVNRMERTFKVEDTDSLYTVSTALVLEDPGHSSDRQPFATIKFRDNSGSIIHSLCYVASSADPTFNVVQPPGQGTQGYRIGNAMSLIFQLTEMNWSLLNIRPLIVAGVVIMDICMWQIFVNHAMNFPLLVWIVIFMNVLNSP